MISLQRVLKTLHSFICWGLIFFLTGCTPGKKKEPLGDEDLIPYAILKIFPHDPAAFTQGLTIADGRLFESTGQADSWIAEVYITTGTQDKKVMLDKKYFGEGIAILNNKIYQLTWKNHVGFIYDLKTFNKIREFQYDHEGWGITHNGKNLIVSDGTDKLRFLDTLSLKPVSVLTVVEEGNDVDKLNELEFVDGFIFANQWQTNYILKIDPTIGSVVGKIDLSALAEKMSPLNPQADVLNGIAYEKKSGMLLVTGKLWPSLFALRLQKKVPD